MPNDETDAELALQIEERSEARQTKRGHAIAASPEPESPEPDVIVPNDPPEGFVERLTAQNVQLAQHLKTVLKKLDEEKNKNKRWAHVFATTLNKVQEVKESMDAAESWEEGDEAYHRLKERMEYEELMRACKIPGQYSDEFGWALNWDERSDNVHKQPNAAYAAYDVGKVLAVQYKKVSLFIYSTVTV
jgi:hypothetical protein